MARDRKTGRKDKPLKPIVGSAAEFPEERHPVKKGVTLTSFNKGGMVGKSNQYAKKCS